MHANIQLKAISRCRETGSHVLNLHTKVLLQVIAKSYSAGLKQTDAYITGTWSPTILELNSSSFNLGSLSMPERDVEDDQTIFSSLGADPLVKTIFVMAEQSTTRRLSHKNSSLFNVISCVPPKDLSKSSRQRIFRFLVSSCRASCSSNVPRRVSLAICLALSNDDSKLPQKLLFNSSSSNLGGKSTPEIEPSPVKDKTIFSSSLAASFSKVILVKAEPSTRRYLRHVNSPFLKFSMDSVYAMCWSLTHRNLGSLPRTFRSSWLSRV